MNSYKVLYDTTPGKLETSILATSLSEAKRKAYIVCAETGYTLAGVTEVMPEEREADSIRTLLWWAVPILLVVALVQSSTLGYILLCGCVLLQFCLGIAKYSRDIVHLAAFVLLYGMLLSAGSAVLFAVEYRLAHPVLSETEQAIANWEKYKVEHGMK